jgi:glycosyltransferase involved in cell wall biosynthesis
VTSPPSRLDRIVTRAKDQGRRVAASVRALGSLRYPGGVDPIEVVDGKAIVRGWARAGTAAITAIVVQVDGEAVALAHTNETDDRARPGIETWLAEIDLPAGKTVDVDAVAVFASGITQRIDRQLVTVPAPPPEPVEELVEAAEVTALPLGRLDHPIDEEVIDPGLLSVRGWAQHEGIARIELDIDGRITTARQMAMPRPDVAEVRDAVHAGFCGFEDVIDLADRLVGDRVTIVAPAVLADGTRELVGEATATVGWQPEVPPVDVHRVDTLRERTAAILKDHRPAASGTRLLVVTHDLGLGGGQLYLHELMLRMLDLREEGEDLRMVVVSQGDGPLRHELEALGIDVHVVFPFPTEPIGYETLMGRLAYLARDMETTAVLVNTAGASIGADLAARLDVPALWAIHESYAPDHFVLAAYGGAAHPSAQDRLDEALTSAAVMIFEADATRELWCSSGDPRRFLHIDYGIDLRDIDAFVEANDVRALRSELGFSDDDVVLLCVGTIEPRKAQASLLRAFARVAPDHPEAVLVLVGDRGDAYGEAVRAYADRLDLGDRLRIEPVVPDCYRWYAAADAFVLASDVESMPRSAIEAMAFGTPAIAADVFGLHDLVEDGVSGFHVEPRDLASLEDALRRFLALDVERRAEMGEHAAAHIRSHHDSRGYARAYRALLAGFAADPHALPEVILGR